MDELTIKMKILERGISNRNSKHHSIKTYHTAGINFPEKSSAQHLGGNKMADRE